MWRAVLLACTAKTSKGLGDTKTLTDGDYFINVTPSPVLKIPATHPVINVAKRCRQQRSPSEACKIITTLRCQRGRAAYEDCNGRYVCETTKRVAQDNDRSRIGDSAARDKLREISVRNKRLRDDRCAEQTPARLKGDWGYCVDDWSDIVIPDHTCDRTTPASRARR